MASHIEVTADVSERFDPAQLRAAISSLTEDDLSQSSPITAGGDEVGVAYNAAESAVVCRVNGHAGSWTKTSEDALTAAVGGVHGVQSVSVTAGGYEPE